MTVRELIAELSKYPQDKRVVYDTDNVESEFFKNINKTYITTDYGELTIHLSD